MGGAHDLATRTREPADPAQICDMFRQLDQLTRIIEREIHAVVLDCTLARRQMLRVTDTPIVRLPAVAS
jgi:hypothetical protein